MNKGHLSVQDAARIKLTHPHTQLLIKLLLTITLISLALIAIYDNHAYVQTKISEYRSKIPSLEYPSKLNEYQSKYYDYENIVHEHVYDKNVKIDENYIDIDYKAEDENIYDEYSDEDVKDKLSNGNNYKSDTVLQGAGFKTYNGFQREDYNENNEGAEALIGKTGDERGSETDNTPNIDAKFDNIYDETDDASEDRESARGFGRTSNKVKNGDKRFETKDDIVEKEKTDSGVREKDNKIDKYINNGERNTDAEVSKDLISESNSIVNKNNAVHGNITYVSQIERPEHGIIDLNNTENTNKSNLDIFNDNDFKEKTITNDAKEPFTKTFKENTIKEIIHRKITYDFENEEPRTQAHENENNTEDKAINRLTNSKPSDQVYNSVHILQTQPSRKTIPETTTKPIAYDIFKYSVKISSNSTSPLQPRPYDNRFRNKFIRTLEANQIPEGASLYFPRAKRRLPQALIIGVRKCGTRALLEMLYLHPRVQKAAGEVHFFDRDENYARGLEWYRQQMPLSYPNQVTIEKSPSYFVTPEAPERIRAMNASVRLLVIVRDPVTRAISDYTQLKIHAAATSPGPVKKFEQLALRDNGEINGNYRPVAVSVYHNFMYAWLEVFPKEQLLIVNGDRLIEDPVPELQRIERFLNLEPHINHENFYFNHTKGFYCLKDNNMEKCLRESKGRKHVRVHPKVIAKMREYFNYHNQLFYELVDENFDWPEE